MNLRDFADKNNIDLGSVDEYLKLRLIIETSMNLRSLAACSSCDFGIRHTLGGIAACDKLWLKLR